MKTIEPLLIWTSKADHFGFVLMRVAIATVFIWIGALKFASYEADSITPRSALVWPTR